MGHLSHHLHDSILTCVMHGGSKGNSFGAEEAQQLQATLKLARREGVNGVILTSSDQKFFCTGGNLREQAGLKTRLQHIRHHRAIRDALKVLADFEKPTVAVVEGDCFGGGMELISCCDSIIASPSALFGFWQRRIGLSFGWGGGDRWLQRLSRKRLQHLVLEARSLTAYEALEVRLVDKIVPRGYAETYAHEWIHSVQKWPAISLKAIKKFESSRETRVFESLLGNPAHQSILKK